MLLNMKPRPVVLLSFDFGFDNAIVCELPPNLGVALVSCKDHRISSVFEENKKKLNEITKLIWSELAIWYSSGHGTHAIG